MRQRHLGCPSLWYSDDLRLCVCLFWAFGSVFSYECTGTFVILLMAESEPRELVEKDKLYRRGQGWNRGLLSLHSQVCPNQIVTAKRTNWISWKDFLRSILPESNFRVQVLLALTRFEGFATSLLGKHISLQGTVKCSSRGVCCALMFLASLQGNVYAAAFPCWRWQLPGTMTSEGGRHESEWSYDPAILPLGAFTRNREQGLEWMCVTRLFTAPALAVTTGWNDRGSIGERTHKENVVDVFFVKRTMFKRMMLNIQWRITRSQRGSSAKWTLQWTHHAKWSKPVMKGTRAYDSTNRRHLV